MAETKDMYESLHESQTAETQQQLSALQESIKSHIESVPLTELGNSIMGKGKEKEKNKTLNLSQLIAAGYANRMSKDILMKYYTGDKNEKSTFFGKIGQMVGDKFLDAVTKQDDSYDSVLIAHEKLVIQKFQTELAGLKSSIIVPAASAPADHHEGGEEHEDVDYDAVSTADNDTKVESTEFGFNMPIGLPIAGIKEKDITSHMGNREAPKAGASSDHKGIDIKAEVGTPLLAPGDGKVITVANQEGKAGQYIEIDHGDYITRYFHLSEQSVKVGDIVKKGTVIGKTGKSGNVTGPHLHYELRYKKEIAYADKKGSGKYKVLNPEKYMDFDGDGKLEVAA